MPVRLTDQEMAEAAARFAGAGKSSTFRRRIRRRAAETGESYTVARIMLLLEAERARLARTGNAERDGV